MGETGEVLVVEGYTDVIALARAGLDNAVATCGTALGEGHFRLASRFARRMVLLFDGDEAGARAAERAYQHLEAFPVQPVVLVLPDGLDPAEFLEARGADALRELAKDARPVVDYMIRRTVGRHDRSTIEGQAAAVAAAVPIVSGLDDPVRRAEYAHLIADLAGVADAAVQTALRRRGGAPIAEVRAVVKRASAQDRLERELLRLLARNAAIFLQLSERVLPDHLQAPGNRERLEILRSAGGNALQVRTTPPQTPPPPPPSPT
ncbi:MAG: toprim domain-containing protein, partial [Actinomycetota bacterium]